MKTRIIPVLLFFAFGLLPAESCKKPATPVTTIGGKGGNCTVTVTPEHHGLFVDTCTIYIKYNSLNVPANGIYDDSMLCVMSDTIPIAVFAGLKLGDYYLFARGYHALYVPPYVKGGVPCTLSSTD